MSNNVSTVKVRSNSLKAHFLACGKSLQSYENALSRADKNKELATDAYYANRKIYTPHRLCEINDQFDSDRKAAKTQYLKELDAIRADFEVEARLMKTPKAARIDDDTVKLLNSGIEYTADEIEAMAKKYETAGNATMLRVLDGYCKDHSIGRLVQEKFSPEKEFQQLRCFQTLAEVLQIFDNFIARMKTATMDDFMFRVNGNIFAEEMEEFYSKIQDGVIWVTIPVGEDGTIPNSKKRALEQQAGEVLGDAREAIRRTPEPEESEFSKALRREYGKLIRQDAHGNAYCV